jgi:hypothetical protein
MAGEMKSDHERLVRAVVENSMAAPFVFKPTHSRKKKVELADLAWVCNNCIILTWMTQKQIDPDRVTNELLREQAIGRNLRQAKWGIKQWRLGHSSLLGVNDWRSFSINYSPDISIIVLSVIDCGEAIARCQDDKAADLGVSLCATIPYSVLKRLAELFGTAVDLVKFLVELRSTGDLSEANAVAWVERYAEDCFGRSGAESLWPGRRLDERFMQVAKNLISARGQPEGGMPKRPAYDIAHLENVFCDISLAEFWRIVVDLRNGVDAVIAGLRYGDTRIYPNVLPLEVYDCATCIIPIAGGDGAPEHRLRAFWENERRLGRMRVGPTIMITLKPSWTALGLFRIKPGTSHIELLLGKKSRETTYNVNPSNSTAPEGVDHDPSLGDWGFGFECPYCHKFVVPLRDTTQGDDNIDIGGAGQVHLKCLNPGCQRLVTCAPTDIKRVNLPMNSVVEIDQAIAHMRPYRGALRSQL